MKNNSGIQRTQLLPGLGLRSLTFFLVDLNPHKDALFLGQSDVKTHTYSTHTVQHTVAMDGCFWFSFNYKKEKSMFCPCYYSFRLKPAGYFYCLQLELGQNKQVFFSDLLVL